MTYQRRMSAMIAACPHFSWGNCRLLGIRSDAAASDSIFATCSLPAAGHSGGERSCTQLLQGCFGLHHIPALLSTLTHHSSSCRTHSSSWSQVLFLGGFIVAAAVEKQVPSHSFPIVPSMGSIRPIRTGHCIVAPMPGLRAYINT